MCKARNARLLETKEWVKVESALSMNTVRNMKARDRSLYAEYVEKAEPIKAIVQF